MGKGGVRHGNKPAQTRERSGATSVPRDSDQRDEQTVEFLPPLKPRPRLVIALAVVFALWIAFLLVLYFVTIFPHRHERRPVTQPSEISLLQAVVPSERATDA